MWFADRAEIRPLLRGCRRCRTGVGLLVGERSRFHSTKENRARRRDDDYRILLTPGASGHLLHHGDHQLAVAIVQVAGIAADLAEEAEFVVSKLRYDLAVPIVITGFGE